jgi:large subunit ribosomal protein L35
MPKMKTNSGAKKRFDVTGTGKIKRKHAYKRHILTKKTTKQKRNLTCFAIVADVDEMRVKRMLVM